MKQTLERQEGVLPWDAMTPIVSVIIPVVFLATSETLTGLYDNPNDEYFDIDEGALVKVEFSKTLRKVIICRN